MNGEGNGCLEGEACLRGGELAEELFDGGKAVFYLVDFALTVWVGGEYKFDNMGQVFTCSTLVDGWRDKIVREEDRAIHTIA